MTEKNTSAKEQSTQKKFEPTNPTVNFGGARTDNHGIVENASDTRGTLKRLITYFGDFKRLFALLTIFVIITTAATVAIPALEGSAIDLIHDGSMNKLILLIIWLVVLFVIQAVTSLLQTRLSAKLSLSITKRMRRDLFDHIVRLPIRYMDSHANGDILSRMTNDVENISSTLSQSLTSFISAALSIAGTLVVIFIYCWQLTLITMVTVFLTVFATKKLSKIMAKEFRKKARVNGQLNALAAEMVTGYRSVAAYNRQDQVIKEYTTQADILKKTAAKAESLSNGVGPVLDCISNIGFVIVAVFGGIFAYNGMITIGVVSAFIVYAKQFIRPVNEVAQIFGSIQTAIAGAERVFAIMDEPAEEGDSPSASGHMTDSTNAPDQTHNHTGFIAGVSAPKATDQADSTGSTIEFRDISFSYVPDVPVIQNFTLTIKPGQKAALVGATGSGKTTIVNLLERFYQADGGDITIGGRSIYNMGLEELRSRMAIVLQDTVLFSGTIADNIRYSDPSLTDAQIAEAAALSNCAGFINALPQGYGTQLVRSGENLSQGQRQLLTIARALVRDPEILILDEATSSVDTKTEKQIQDATARLMKDRTCLIIAHRLSTILDADIIVVMDKGRIAESGTHEELMQARGIYYTLYMTQFEGGRI